MLHPGLGSLPEAGHGKLEKGQRRATQMIQGYKDFSYEDRS